MGLLPLQYTLLIKEVLRSSESRIWSVNKPEKSVKDVSHSSTLPYSGVWYKWKISGKPVATSGQPGKGPHHCNNSFPRVYRECILTSIVADCGTSWQKLHCRLSNMLKCIIRWWFVEEGNEYHFNSMPYRKLPKFIKPLSVYSMGDKSSHEMKLSPRPHSVYCLVDELRQGSFCPRRRKKNKKWNLLSGSHRRKK